jgi:hypothetical protein
VTLPQKVGKPCRKSDMASLAIMPSFPFPLPNFAKKRNEVYDTVQTLSFHRERGGRAVDGASA